LIWNYHAQTLQQAGATFTSNAAIFGKVYFPRLIVPLSVALSSMISFAIQTALFGVFWIYFKFFTAAGAHFSAGLGVLLLPLLLLHAAIVSLGAGLLLSSCTAKYRDLQYVLPLIIQVWLYLTPVIYPLSEVPARFRWLVALNPLSVVVEMSRYVLLGQGSVHFGQYLYSLAASVVFFFIGVMIFQRTERTFIDTV